MTHVAENGRDTARVAAARAPSRPLARPFVALERMALALTLLALLGGAASAAPPPPDPASVAKAREAFAEGVALYDRTPPDYAGALARFRAAYEAQPAAGIKRNIALCLRGLGRDAEAADALEEMLAAGDGAAKPAVRDAAARTLTELHARVATAIVTVRVVRPRTDDGLLRAEEGVPYEVTVDGVVVPAARLLRPLRLDPGPHVLRARAEGRAPAEVAILAHAGERELPVSLELVALAPLAVLRVRACRGEPCVTLPRVALRIDDVEIARGAWEGPIPPGDHVLEARDPDGPRFRAHVVVGASGDRRVRIVLATPTPTLEEDAGPPPPSPAPYAVLRPDDADAGERLLQRAELARSKEPRGYWQIGLAVHGMGFRIRSDFDAYTGGTRRGLVGAAAVVRAGYSLTPIVQVGGYGELGGLTAEDTRAAKSPAGRTVREELSGSLWALAPELRLRTTGDPLRAIAGVAAGLTGQTISAQAFPDGATSPSTRNAGGVGPFGLFELGGQARFRGTLAELTFFFDVRPAASIQDAGRPLFANAVEARYGLRLMLGGGF